MVSFLTRCGCVQQQAQVQLQLQAMQRLAAATAASGAAGGAAPPPQNAGFERAGSSLGGLGGLGRGHLGGGGPLGGGFPGGSNGLERFFPAGGPGGGLPADSLQVSQSNFSPSVFGQNGLLKKDWAPGTFRVLLAEVKCRAMSSSRCRVSGLCLAST